MKMGFTKIACRLTEPTYALSASQTLEGVCQRTILMQNSGNNLLIFFKPLINANGR